MIQPQYHKENIVELMDRIVRRTFQMDFTWDWPAGVALYGVSRALEVTDNKDYLEQLRQWIDGNLERGVPAWTVNSVSIGHALLTLYQRTQEEKYLNIALQMADYLKEDAPRFADGILQHTVSQHYNFPEQAWVDTMFMAGYFLVRVGVLLDRDEYLEDGLGQYHGHERFLQDRASHLYYHGWDHRAQNNMSGVYWARGNAWAAYTMTRALRLISVFHPSYMKIMDSVRDQLAALVRMQTEEGMWRTVINNPASYEETSGSAGIAASLIEYHASVGQQLYHSYIHKSIAALFKQVSADGTVMNVSGGTAVMNDVEGYMNVHRNRIQGWGQGLSLAFLAALLQSQSPE